MPRQPKRVSKESILAANGIKCPRCNWHMSFVNWSRPKRWAGTTNVTGDGFVVRCRECRECGFRFLTEEKTIGVPGEEK